MAQSSVNSFSKARLESLTDGLFATVMTILILSLVVPIITGSNLSEQLTSAIGSQIPNLLVYVASFVVLLIMWMGHNNLFRHVARVTPKLMLLNGIFLLFVGLVPFSTAFLGRYPLQQPAVLVYSVNFLAIAIMYNVFTRYIRNHGLVDRKEDLDDMNKANLVPLALYGLGIAFSFVSPYISLALFALMPIYYLGRNLLSPLNHPA